VDLTDGGRRHRHGVPLQEDGVGTVPQLLEHDLLGQAGGHRRHVLLQLSEGLLRGRRQAVGDEADHLPELHHRALHLTELGGDVLRGADGELLLEGGPPGLTDGAPAHLGDRPVHPAACRQTPHPGLAAPAFEALVHRHRPRHVIVRPRWPVVPAQPAAEPAGRVPSTTQWGWR
jgi:hypothetical protein